MNRLEDKKVEIELIYISSHTGISGNDEIIYWRKTPPFYPKFLIQ